MGISTGMRAPDAEALARQNQLLLLPYRPQTDLRALQKIASECQCFSPFVALENAEQPAALMLDVKGIVPLWGSTQEQAELRLLEQIDQWSQEKGLRAEIAIASTTALAWAASHFADSLAGTIKDQRVIPSNCPKEVTSKLPVESLRIDKKVSETLISLGIERVGQLLSIPKASLRSRFGPHLLWRLDQLLGDAPEPLSFYEPEAPLAMEYPFETAVKNEDVLEAVLASLLQRLTQELEARSIGALHFRITYFLDDTHERSASEQLDIRLLRPTQCSKELAELAALQIPRLQLSQAVSTIRVDILKSSPLEIRQRKLFEDEAQQNPYELALLINRLACRIGTQRVLRVEKKASHDPQRILCFLPAIDFEPRPYRLTNLRAERLRRFPLLFRRKTKQHIQVETDCDKMPSEVLMVGWQKVVRCGGPERVETGWWRGTGLRYDSYWIELCDGSRLWLDFDRRTRQWHLSGEFF